MGQPQHITVGGDHGGLFFWGYVGGQPHGAGGKNLRQSGAVGFDMGQGGTGQADGNSEATSASLDTV